MFTNFVQVNDEYVAFGNGNKSMICGKGSINALGITELKDVLFMDGLKANLISINKIIVKKYLVKFNHKDCTMYDNTRSVIVKGIRLEDSYYCVGDSPPLVCNIASLNV